MSDRTKIEYVDASWNPVSGCTKVSSGCKNCWAERQAKRWGQQWGTVRLHPERLSQPSRWKKPRRIAVCFMGDVCHDDVPDIFFARIMAVAAMNPQHTFLFLTKRPERLRQLLVDRQLPIEGKMRCAPEWLDFPSGRSFPRVLNEWPIGNVILGVSVEDQRTADERIPILLDTPAARRWVSIEPMLGPVDLRREWLHPHGALDRTYRGQIEQGMFNKHQIDALKRPHLDWVVLGGESGLGARPMHPDWVRKVRDDCAAAGVPFWFKQWGSWVPGISSDDDVWNNAAQHHWIMDGRNPYSEDVVSYRVGKQRAGRLLDGREHAEVPA